MARTERRYGRAHEYENNLSFHLIPTGLTRAILSWLSLTLRLPVFLITYYIHLFKMGGFNYLMPLFLSLFALSPWCFMEIPLSLYSICLFLMSPYVHYSCTLIAVFVLGMAKLGAAV